MRLVFTALFLFLFQAGFAQNAVMCRDAGSYIGKSITQVHQLLTSKKLGAPNEAYAKTFQKNVISSASLYPKSKLYGRTYLIPGDYTSNRDYVVFTMFRDGKCMMVQIVYKSRYNMDVNVEEGIGKLLTELQKGDYKLVKEKEYEKSDGIEFASKYTDNNAQFDLTWYSYREAYIMIVMPKE